MAIYSVTIFSSIIFCMTVQLWLVANALIGFRQPLEAGYPVWPQYAYLLVVFLAQAIGIWAVRFQLSQSTFIQRLLPLFVAELLWTVLMINAAFKILVFHERPKLAQAAFVGLTLGAVISKIFWPEFKSWGERLWARIIVWPRDIQADLIVFLGIIALLYVPDTQAVLARMFLGDQFHHFDSFAAPAWGFAKGGILNVDVMTEYGIGIPVVMAWFAKLTGGFSYTHILWFLMGGTILYFILCFIFLRLWLRSVTLSVLSVLLAIKFQMFHPGVAPFVFTLPSATVIRYFWDIIFFLLLLGHLRTLQRRYLLAAAVCCGVHIFWMTTCGYCQTIAFMAYLVAILILPDLRTHLVKEKKGLVSLIASVILIGLTAIGLLALTEGRFLSSREFWVNMQEFNNYFLSGFGLMPMYETIQNKESLAGFMGFFIPVVYMGTFLVTAGFLFYRQTARENLMAVILSIYGLAIYHYYIGRSAPTSYDVVCIPYVFILAFWLQQWLNTQSLRWQRPVLIALLLMVVYALWTNSTYLAYPNMLNVSRNPIIDPLVVQPLPDGRSYFNQNATKIPESQKTATNAFGQREEDLKFEKDFKTARELKNYYAKESDFKIDAALIDALTSSHEPVALLSSFEISMLMQADRRQFFYYSPILIARPLHMRNFPNSTMYSLGHLKRTLAQLETAKPPYIFMEKIYLKAPGFKNFQDAYLGAVLNYVFANYVPYKQGQYLVAMKRKGENV